MSLDFSDERLLVVSAHAADFVWRAGGAIALYAALTADAALDLIGAKLRILIEGRFAQAEVFVRALAGLRPADRIYVSPVENDVSYGALRLLNPSPYLYYLRAGGAEIIGSSPEALARLEGAVKAQKAVEKGNPISADKDGEAEAPVELSRRAIPLLDLLRAAAKSKADVVWDSR